MSYVIYQTCFQVVRDLPKSTKIVFNFRIIFILLYDDADNINYTPQRNVLKMFIITK